MQSFIDVLKLGSPLSKHPYFIALISGKMTKEQMDMKGWAYDPFGGGTKPLKSELDYYYDSDEDIVRIKQRIEYQKAIANTLEEIMNNLRWRHTHIKNILDWKKFVSGT